MDSHFPVSTEIIDADDEGISSDIILHGLDPAAVIYSHHQVVRTT